MENILYVLISFFVSLLCGIIAIPIICNFCKKHSLYDVPNERKVHSAEIPRLGGLCFLPSMLLAFVIVVIMFLKQTSDSMVTMNAWSIFFFVSLLIIYVLGVVDDLYGVDAKVKFLMQTIAASIMPACGLYINNLYGFLGFFTIPFWIGAPLTIFVIVFINNAINLIDGIDGLSASLSILALGGFLYCFLSEDILAYGVLIAAFIGVLTSFLYFNLFGNAEKGTKIFMGDAGSLSLGFVLGYLFVKFSMDNPNVMPYRDNSLLVSFSFLIVPCFDVCRVILVRMRKKTPIFGADKNHIHHKLLRAGLNQYQTLGVIVALEVVFLVLNILLHTFVSISFIVFIDLVLWVVFHLLLNMRIELLGEKR